MTHIIDTEEKIETFLTWVMANRDVGAREWSENIEPELRKQLDAIVLQRVTERLLDELQRIEQMDNTIVVPFRHNILDEVEEYEDLLYRKHFVYIDDRVKELQALQTKEGK